MKRIRVSSSEAFAPIVGEELKKIAKRKDGPIRIGLPGGRGSVPVVQGVVNSSSEIVKRIELYLVDERLEGATNKETLLDVGLQDAIDKGTFSLSQLHVPQLDSPLFDFEGELDLVFLGIGEDGHIASLFPGSFPALDALGTADVVLVEDSPKPPLRRATVSYRALRTRARKCRTFLMFFGEGKRAAFDRFMANTEMPSTLPVLFFPRELFNVTIVTDL
ncbi:MAG: 6-phosphogluconolactonase [Sphaerochaetaceae bacterium]|jgi:6-phosphogluconolactonase/glucosamine-6-phosphate isomerase/deaminase